MNEQNHILLVEDDPDGRRSLTEAIADAGYQVVAAATGAEGLARFQEHRFAAVLTDLVLPDIDGIEVLTRIQAVDPQMPVLIMTAYGSVPSSVKALKAGAYDYIIKPLDLDDLQSKLARAVEAHSLRTRVTELNQALQGGHTLQSMVLVSPAMQQVARQVRALAETNATVFIHGESGSGKELIARALHAESRRARQPFVAVNCGALSESLLESELFGHEKGAFTGAVSQRKGAFERADGGTLFLDEIGDAPKSVQVKLLRALEDRELVRVGGQHSFRVDVRLISASNKDLDALVEDREFRQDLLYRLKVVSLELPPLRARREDVQPLAEHFIAQACREHGRRIESIQPDFYERLLRCDWPGNVRQLRNAVEAAVIMAAEPVLRAGSLSLNDEQAAPAKTAVTFPDGMSLAAIEREVLEQTLRRYDGNRSLTADKLGLSRRTIQRQIKEHNLPY